MSSRTSNTVSTSALEAACAQHLHATLELLREMVSINSFTLNRAGVRQVSEVTARSFESLGFRAEQVPSTNPDFGSHLVLQRGGSGPETIAFVSHLDTVFPPEEEALHDFKWREEGTRLYGPGTLDVKGGTVLVHLILTVLRDVAPEVFEGTNWIFLLNSSEEMPSADFGKLCWDRIPSDALAALVVEGGARAGTSHAVVTARKGRALFKVEALGRGSHAGNLHERGVNAITQLAHTIQRMDALTNHDTGLTVNVGVLSGGTVVNRVPHHAEVEVEMRAFEPEIYQAGVSAMQAMEGAGGVRSLEDGEPSRVTVAKISEIPPWPRNDATESLFETWRESGRELGMTIVRQERGGISDGNHICGHAPTLDGLGPCGDHAHCSERSADGARDQEYVERDSLVPRALLSCRALLKMLG